MSAPGELVLGSESGTMLQVNPSPETHNDATLRAANGEFRPQTQSPTGAENRTTLTTKSEAGLTPQGLARHVSGALLGLPMGGVRAPTEVGTKRHLELSWVSPGGV